MGKEERKRSGFYSLRLLKGNTRVSVIFLPLWSIPYAMFNFYLGLYMKARGITDQQLGDLIAIGFLAGTLLSLFSGMITDHLGRKKTTLIFDFITWPLTLCIYVWANNFWHFVLAAVCNNFGRIVNVSYTLMLVEDATDEERKAAFALSNMINILSGVFVPLAGGLVNRLGIIPAERILLGLAIISMTTMIFWRNHYYVETRVGSEILQENQKKKLITGLRINLFGNTISYLKRKPSVLIGMILTVLFNVYLPVGTINSLYFVPYLAEQLNQGEVLVSLLGLINSVTIWLVLAFLLPRLQQGLFPLLLGVGFHLCYLIILLVIKPGTFWPLTIAIIFYALGFGLFRPLVDALFADITEGKERAGLYGLNSALTSILSALAGFYSGRLYERSPVAIYLFSLVIILFCLAGLFLYAFLEKKPLGPWVNLPRRKKESPSSSRIS
ncbi:MAG: MFS transporter [Firmicutes bacterium]|nr:MFS transporter [Bacillota bacterium]